MAKNKNVKNEKKNTKNNTKNKNVKSKVNKKNNIDKNVIEKHKKKIIIATIIGIAAIVGVLGTTFAMFMSSASSSQQDMYKTGGLSVTFNETTGSKINLTNQYPMSDEQGLRTTPYTFTVTNNGSYNIAYTVKLSNYSSNIKVSINNTTPNTLNNIYTNLDTGTLIPGESRTFELRLWVAESVTSATSYTGTISVSGQAVRVPYFVDKSGANAPTYPTGMIPVVYDGVNDTWMVADTSKGWYSYQNQVWANAVTVNDSTYRSAVAGTPIPMSAIDTMWVWIPRYKYQIPSNIGSGSNVTSPPQIDVAFESGTNTTGTYREMNEYGYYTHIAFRNNSDNSLNSPSGSHGGWDSELSGIWVGKFETGGTADKPLVKPDIVSLTNQNVSTQFQTSLKFAGGTMDTSSGAVTYGSNNYGITRNSTTDSHMAKNTEWGAVAYLSQSKYGKNGNSNYSGRNKEIYINNSSNYYTGRSYGAINTSNVGTEYGTYSYNDKSCSSTSSGVCTGSKTANTGTGASTTGTIYGIYDMSGGADEYTMSNWNGYSGYTSSSNSGFNGTYGAGGSKTDGVSFPSNQRYYDKYTGTSSSTATSDKSIKGDATWETQKWYSDDAHFVIANYPWALRGGSYSNASAAGAFFFRYQSIKVSSGRGFRSALIP